MPSPVSPANVIHGSRGQSAIGRSGLSLRSSTCSMPPRTPMPVPVMSRPPTPNATPEPKVASRTVPTAQRDAQREAEGERGGGRPRPATASTWPFKVARRSPRPGVDDQDGASGDGGTTPPPGGTRPSSRRHGANPPTWWQRGHRRPQPSPASAVGYRHRVGTTNKERGRQPRTPPWRGRSEGC